MCGIAGILGESPVDTDRVRSMVDALAHRGPDGEGVTPLADGRVVLGHRRLSILDLTDAGAQPMACRDRFTIVFNGEIYNYVELRQDLELRGHEFRSETDTEVLLAGYAEYGEAVLSRLDGMFSFAVFDSREGTLFAARDRFGEKPYFYSFEGGEFAFASEMKALFAGGVSPAVNRRMLFHYLAYDSVLDALDPSATWFQRVKRLPPAHCLTVRPGRPPVVRRYWEIRPERRETAIRFADACARFRSLLETSITRRLRSNVPLGSSLSGGLDSSTIVLLLSKLAGDGAERKTFSARFDDPALDEGRWIGMVAERAGVAAHDTHPDGATLAAELPAVVAHQEEPFGSAAVVAQWELMKLAKANDVTVLLDGQGADETLAGYLHYFRTLFTELLLHAPDRLDDEYRAYVANHGAAFPIALDRRFKLEARYPWLLRALGRFRRRFGRPDYFRDLDPGFAEEHRTAPPPFVVPRSVNEALRHATTEQGLVTLLRFADRNAMAFAREVRLPFLSHELVEFLFTLPADFKIGRGTTKRILREAMWDVLPPELTARKDKLGFRPPQDAWMAHPDVVERTREAKRRLVAEGIVAAPAADRDWAYLVTGEWLTWAEGLRGSAPDRGSAPGDS